MRVLGSPKPRDPQGSGPRSLWSVRFGAVESKHARFTRRGFSLIELLVVIGVLILLAGILIPVVNRASKAGARTRTAADLAMIGVALEAYKADFGNYPQIDTLANDPTAIPNLGLAVLTKALVGPGPATTVFTSSLAVSPYQPGTSVNDRVALVETTLPPGTSPDWIDFLGRDGHDGPGFKTRMTGSPVRGPYLQPDKIRLNGMGLLTSNGTPILYFPVSPLKPTVSNAGPPVGFVDRTGTGLRTSLYNADDNLRAFKHLPADVDNLARDRIRVMLGDTNANGYINSGENAKITGPYVLWASGTDGKFGPENPTVSFEVQNCDDILSPIP